MADIPPSNLPVPIVPGPVTDRSEAGAAPVTGSKIRSRPPLSKTPRLPGTYAANYGGDDMNWRRGVGVLWTLFALAAVGELVRAAFYMLAGYADWPLIPDLARVSIGALVFTALWLGWGWTRWVLVVTDFLFGVWLVMMVVAKVPPGEPTIVSLPKLALGVIYLGTAGYLAFSADVVDFVRHRREEGRGWVVVPVALLAAGYVALVIAAQVPYGIYLGVEAAPALRFGDETLHAMCDHWDADALAARGDATFLAMWPDFTRKRALASLSPLGELKATHKSSAKSAGTAADAARTGFILGYNYDCERVDFTHGHARFAFALTKHPFGAWQLNNFVVYDVQIDPVPALMNTPPSR